VEFLRGRPLQPSSSATVHFLSRPAPRPKWVATTPPEREPGVSSTTGAMCGRALLPEPTVCSVVLRVLPSVRRVVSAGANSADALALEWNQIKAKGLSKKQNGGERHLERVRVMLVETWALWPKSLMRTCVTIWDRLSRLFELLTLLEDELGTEVDGKKRARCSRCKISLRFIERHQSAQPAES